MFGAHELCIGREGSALQLKRWSRSEQCSKLWAALYFLTWEGESASVHLGDAETLSCEVADWGAEMVLFYCTFVALKARNRLTVQIHPEEFKLRREKRLFQACVLCCFFFSHRLFSVVNQPRRRVKPLLHALTRG